MLGDALEGRREDSDHLAITMVTHALAPPQILNMLFEVVACLPAVQSREQFARILSRLVRLGADFDAKKASYTAMLMNELYSRQSKLPSPSSPAYSHLLQSLVSLHIAVCLRAVSIESPLRASESVSPKKRRGFDADDTTNPLLLSSIQLELETTDVNESSSGSTIQQEEPSFTKLVYDSSDEDGEDGSSAVFWDGDNVSDIELSGDDPMQPITIQKVGGSSNWRAVKSVQSFDSGKHTFEVRIDADPASSNGWKLVIGVVPNRFQVHQSGKGSLYRTQCRCFNHIVLVVARFTLCRRYQRRMGIHLWHRLEISQGVQHPLWLESEHR